MAVFFYKVSDPFGLSTREDIRKAEQKLSAVQFELANCFDEPSSMKDGFGSGLGGDPFLFILSKLDLHQAAVDDQLFTAASTGKEYIWNPHYINALSFAGLRFVIAHETQHTFLNHVPRMVKRHHSIFNKVLDYFANNYAIADLKQRQKLFDESKFKDNVFKEFSEHGENAYFEFFKKSNHCQKPVLIDELRESILNPFSELEKAKSERYKAMIEGCAVPSAMRRENTYKHTQSLRVSLSKNDVRYYFDKNIPSTMTTPEALYDYMVKGLPVCTNCSRIGMYPIPKKVNEKMKKAFKESDYPTSDDLIDILKKNIKKHNVVLKNRDKIVADAELLDEKRFLNMLKGHKEKNDQENIQDLSNQKIPGLEGINLKGTKVIGIGPGGGTFTLGQDPNTNQFKLNMPSTAAPVIPGARNVSVDSDNADILSFINAIRTLKGEGELDDKDKAEVEKISPDLSNKFFKEGEEPTETEKQELSAIVKKFTGLDPYATSEDPGDCQDCDGKCEHCDCKDHEPTEEEKKEQEAFEAMFKGFFEEVQDRYYDAVKKKIYFDWAVIPDDVLKKGRETPAYNETFLKSLTGFFGYLMSELSAIDKNRSVDEYFEVLKKSINNTLVGYFLIRSYMDTVYKIEQEYSADVGRNREENKNRIIHSLDEMFELLKRKRLSILSEFHLLGGYSDEIDMHMNPNWINAKTIDCPECCRKIDVFSLNKDKDISHSGGNTCSPEEEEGAAGNGGKTDSQRKVDMLALKNKLMQAMSYARAAGFEPAGYEELLGRLSRSRLRWQDFISSKRKEAESGGKRDYSRFKNRHLSLGLITPKRMEAFFNVYVLIDTSGSMSHHDMEKGLSQITNLTNGRGYVICADAQVYWKEVKKLSKFSVETLSGLKVTGRGGTQFVQEFCRDFQMNMPKDAPYPDLIICITDGEFYSNDFSDLKIPKCPFMWLQTSTSKFEPSFGRVFNINNE
jgi:predicted metal-dependent peptidase